MTEELNTMYGSCPTKRRFNLNTHSLTAAQSRERSDNSIKIKVEQELGQIYEDIYEVSGKGEYSVKVNKLLSEQALERLKELGYKYEPIGENSMDEGFIKRGYEISW